MSDDRTHDPLADLLDDGDDIYGKADKGKILWREPGQRTSDPASAPSGTHAGSGFDAAPPVPTDDEGDPLSGSSSNPYGSTRASEVLEQLVSSGHPALVAHAMEQFLRRLALLELWVEERGLEVEEGDLSGFLAKHAGEVDDATYQLSQLLFGKVASREGG